METKEEKLISFYNNMMDEVVELAEVIASEDKSENYTLKTTHVLVAMNLLNYLFLFTIAHNMDVKMLMRKFFIATEQMIDDNPLKLNCNKESI